MPHKKDVLKAFTKFTGKDLCRSPFINKYTFAQVFFCEFYEIVKKHLFYRQPLGDYHGDGNTNNIQNMLKSVSRDPCWE